ncbi:MAG: SMC-Scp complex subunit ScpB [Thermoguttaceae bacterium]
MPRRYQSLHPLYLSKKPFFPKKDFTVLLGLRVYPVYLIQLKLPVSLFSSMSPPKKTFFSPVQESHSISVDAESEMQDGFSGNDDEEGQILSLDSLRAAFSDAEHSAGDAGFGWKSNQKEKKRSRNNDLTPLSLYREEEEDNRSGEIDSKDVESNHDVEGSTVLTGDDEHFVDQHDSDHEDEDRDELLGEDGGESEEELAEVEDDPTLEHRIELSPQSLFEAMLFVGDKESRPLRSEKASELMRNVPVEEIDVIAQMMTEQYQVWNCPYEVIAFEGGYRLTLRDEFESVRAKFYGRIKEARLSQSAIDVLAIVAYKQPLTAEEVQTIRKQPVGPLLAQLVRRDLLTIIRENQGNRRVAYYQTTDRFLRLFNLDSIDDLPISDELS